MVRKSGICGCEKLERKSHAWTNVVNARFDSAVLKCLEYPAAIIMVATVVGGRDCGC